MRASGILLLVAVALGAVLAQAQYKGSTAVVANAPKIKPETCSECEARVEAEDERSASERINESSGVSAATEERERLERSIFTKTAELKHAEECKAQLSEAKVALTELTQRWKRLSGSEKAAMLQARLESEGKAIHKVHKMQSVLSMRVHELDTARRNMESQYSAAEKFMQDWRDQQHAKHVAWQSAQDPRMAVEYTQALGAQIQDLHENMIKSITASNDKVTNEIKNSQLDGLHDLKVNSSIVFAAYDPDSGKVVGKPVTIDPLDQSTMSKVLTPDGTVGGKGKGSASGAGSGKGSASGAGSGKGSASGAGAGSGSGKGKAAPKKFMFRELGIKQEKQTLKELRSLKHAVKQLRHHHHHKSW